MGIVQVHKDVVISSMHIEFCEQVFSFEFIKFHLYIRHRIVILFWDIIEFVIVHHQSIFAFVLLWYIEHRRCIGRVSVLYETFLEFFQEILAEGFEFLLI